MSSVKPLGCRAACSGSRTRRSPAALLVLAAWLLWLALPLHAAPAPWYYWRSKVDGARVCAQTSPGPGWGATARLTRAWLPAAHQGHRGAHALRAPNTPLASSSRLVALRVLPATQRLARPLRWVVLVAQPSAASRVGP